MRIYDSFGPNPRALRMFLLEKGLAQVTEQERATIFARWLPNADLAWWRRREVQRVLGVAAGGTAMLMGGLLLWNRTLRRAVAQRTDALQKELAALKKLIARWPIPVANMWCTQTPKPTTPVRTVDAAT